MERITAPFTDEQVERLTEYQNLRAMHPFTCCSPYDVPKCTRASGESDGVLIPRTEGFICPCGRYTQDWAYAFMADPVFLEEWKRFLGE